jgi:uncharacterized membrane protein YgaE (UPF0421/DUF939 family)
MSAWFHVSRNAVLHSARTALAAVISTLLARSLLNLPEFYWAPVSTVVILLSSISPVKLAWQRFAGTALGAALGAIIATYFTPNWAVYGIGMFVSGLVSSLFRIGNAYRFVAITLTIVLLVPHTHAGWIVAFHRFVEVSLGIAVALLITTIWRLGPPE